MNPLIFYQLVMSVVISWDASPSDHMGYKVYAGLSPGNYDQWFDAGNNLNYEISPDLQPSILRGVPFYYAVTAYDNTGDESEFSNEISYTEPVPEMRVEMLSPGTVRVTAFPGTFTLQGSTDLQNWGDDQTFTMIDSSSQKLSVLSSVSMRFFRLKYIPYSPPTMVAKFAERKTLQTDMPPMPPLLPPKKIKLRNKIKYWWNDTKFKLSYALRYQPGHHPDTRKGAERLK